MVDSHLEEEVEDDTIMETGLVQNKNPDLMSTNSYEDTVAVIIAIRITMDTLHHPLDLDMEKQAILPIISLPIESWVDEGNDID